MVFYVTLAPPFPNWFYKADIHLSHKMSIFISLLWTPALMCFIKVQSYNSVYTLKKDLNVYYLLKCSYGWNHELKSKTYIKQISCDAKFICFNPFKRRYNTSRRGRGMVVSKCLHGRCDSTHLRDRKCKYHFTPLIWPRVGDLVLILWLSLV